MWPLYKTARCSTQHANTNQQRHLFAVDVGGRQADRIYQGHRRPSDLIDLTGRDQCRAVLRLINRIGPRWLSITEARSVTRERSYMTKYRLLTSLLWPVSVSVMHGVTCRAQVRACYKLADELCHKVWDVIRFRLYHASIPAVSILLRRNTAAVAM